MSKANTKKDEKKSAPVNAAKAIRLPVPDFSNPDRAPSCLEQDFPIASINALSDLEGNAGKPIYQMSKWWARRRSSVFRALLLAAAIEAPKDSSQAAKLIWDHYYCNHQKAGSFKNLKVLDCFMGGATTLVEGSRLGMQMTGIDLNPVACFVAKNELACSDPEQVKALFTELENKVKPQIQPFYNTVCPRGHKGRWLDERTGEEADLDPLALPAEERAHYRWEGPEIIYSFWAKHGPCQVSGCEHRTPLFKSPLIAQKELSTQYLDLNCPHCGHKFHADLGETRIAPGAERVILDDEPPFTELGQETAELFKAYDKGKVAERLERTGKLINLLPQESALHCPSCGKFSAQNILDCLNRHADRHTKAAERKKSDFSIKSKKVQSFLLIHPEWLKGSSGLDEKGEELGGYAGADAAKTARWYEERAKNLELIEVRGEELPEQITLADGTSFSSKINTIPKNGEYVCAKCGIQKSYFQNTKESKHTMPISVYAFQCYCPQCAEEGYTYNGRYFKSPDDFDITKLKKSEYEWDEQKNDKLKGLWPKEKVPFGERTTKRDNIQDWGYTHWWKMFNPRQLLVHSQLLKALCELPENEYPLDVREQVLGAFQQYLRNQNMFAFWNVARDELEPMMSNANYHPKNLVLENNIFSKYGRGNWASNYDNIPDALNWAQDPWELYLSDNANSKSEKIYTQDPVIPGSNVYCGSSSDLSMLPEQEKFDLIITDPPFGDNIFYADLADFFYVWLRLALRKWYADLPMAENFDPERSPHSLEAIENIVEHPDDREIYEKEPFINANNLEQIRELMGDGSLALKAPNPLYRMQPSRQFYSQMLAACWGEAAKRLKDGGLMAFTFHHNRDEAWIDVLKALFEAGYLLVATYPVRSDESKGENAAFGSQKIEYDIIHVCRKRLKEAEPVAWAKMRRWVKEEAEILKELLEQTHGKVLPESDLRVILRGKALEFYSCHYGKVFTGNEELLDVSDALLGINQLLDDILESSSKDTLNRAPDSAEPATRIFLNIFAKNKSLHRDDLHKRLRGTGLSQAAFEAKGWLRSEGKKVMPVSVQERYEFFRIRKRESLKSDLDQAYFCIGTIFNKENLDNKLENDNLSIKKSVPDILDWFAKNHADREIREKAGLAAARLKHWQSRVVSKKAQPSQVSLFEVLEDNA